MTSTTFDKKLLYGDACRTQRLLHCRGCRDGKRWRFAYPAIRHTSPAAGSTAHKTHFVTMLADITSRNATLKDPSISFLAMAGPCTRYYQFLFYIHGLCVYFSRERESKEREIQNTKDKSKQTERNIK